MDKLTEIMAHKRHEIQGELRKVSEEELSGLADPDRPSLFRALAGCDTLSVIAEIKRKSPSAGHIAKRASAVDQAKLYHPGRSRRYFGADRSEILFPAPSMTWPWSLALSGTTTPQLPV